jgi:hypothetical protein
LSGGSYYETLFLSNGLKGGPEFIIREQIGLNLFPTLCGFLYATTQGI